MTRTVFVTTLLSTVSIVSGCRDAPMPTTTPTPSTVDSPLIDGGEDREETAPGMHQISDQEQATSAPPGSSVSAPASIDDAINWLSDPLRREIAMLYLKDHKEAALEPLLTLHVTTPTLDADYDRMMQSDYAREILIEFGSELVEPRLNVIMANVDAQQNAIMLRNAYNAAAGFDDGAGPSWRLSGISAKCTLLREELRQASKSQRGSSASEKQPTFQSEKSAKTTKASSHTFPRTDGVYRIKRRTRLIGFTNADVYDYIVFTKGDSAYTIKGDYLPPNNYYLEQPSGNQPGAFHMKSFALDDQPAFILEWVADPSEKQPLSGSYTIENGRVRFTIKTPGNPSSRPFETAYEGQSTDNGALMTETSTAGGSASTIKRVYEFVPVK